MAEVACAGEGHGHAAFVRGGNDFRIADRAAGLNGSGGTGGSSCDEAVCKREKCVAADHTAFKGEAGFTSFPDRNAAGIDAAHLACTDAERAIGTDVNDGV